MRQAPSIARHRAQVQLFVYVCIFLALILLVLAGTRGLAATRPMTPGDVIGRSEERFRTLQDYDCMVDIESRLGKRVETGTGQFWFKQPGMLRVKIVSGPKKGSQIARDSTGQVRGSKGGLLGRMVRRMKATDKRLLTIRGASILALDWGSFYLKYRAAALRPDAQVALAPHATADATYDVVLTYPDQGKSVREVYSVDPHQWVVVEGSVYENDTRVEHVVFREIRFNPGLTDDYFRL